MLGRQIQPIYRDSKGQPQEAARVARELVNTDGCEILLDAEASSGAYAVQEVVRDLGVLCVHANSETSSLTADPKLRVATAFRSARQGVHDAIVGGALFGQGRGGEEADEMGDRARRTMRSAATRPRSSSIS